MSHRPGAPGRILAWAPAVVVLLVVSVLAHEQARVSYGDIVAYLAFVLVCLTLPGTLVWRWVGPGGRPLWEDLTLGTILAFSFEIPVYLVARSVGLPVLTVLWPLSVVIGAVVLWRRRRHEGDAPEPVRAAPALDPRVSWSLAALIIWGFVWLARNVWSVRPVTPSSLRAPHVDEPFHISLVAELMHHFPGQMPFVEGVPLYYHWFSYVNMADAATLSGVEPVVLLRVLGVGTAILLSMLGVAAVVSRLTDRTWPAVVATAVLVLTSAVDVFGWTQATAPFGGKRYLSELLYLSPTTTYAGMSFVLLVLVLVEALRGRRLPLVSWGIIALLMTVVAGSKSTFLPVVLSGLVAVVLVHAVIRRTLHRRAAILVAIALVVLVLTRHFVYGAASRDLSWSPLTSAGRMAAGLGLAPSSAAVPTAVALVVAACYAIAQLAVGVGAFGLLADRETRDTDFVFFAASMVAAVGVVFTLDHPGRAQFYFLHANDTLCAIATAVGLAVLVDKRPGWRYALLTLGAVATGGLLAVVVAALTPNPPADGGTGLAHAVQALLLPQVVVAVLLLAAGALFFHLVQRWQPMPRARVAALLVFAVLGLSLPRAVAETVKMPERPWPTAASVRPQIGEGGLDAAGWIREHSSSNDLVATNGHCKVNFRRVCSHTSFWVAAYTQRRVLVEGWAYIAPETVGQPSTPLTNSNLAPFWDQERLDANDAVFHEPTAAAVRELADTYGVRWLLVDLRDSKVDLDGLLRVADLRHRTGEYAVVELRR